MARLKPNDGDLARDQWCDVPPFVGSVSLLRQGLTPDVGEVQGLVPLEQSVVGLEALALVVVDAPPLLEVRSEVGSHVDLPPLQRLFIAREIRLLLLQGPSVQRRVLPWLRRIQQSEREGKHRGCELLASFALGNGDLRYRRLVLGVSVQPYVKGDLSGWWRCRGRVGL